MAKAPHKDGEVFKLSVRALQLANEKDDPARANYRAELDGREVEELAQSMRAHGQLSPVLVYWTGDQYVLAAGFKRLAALALNGAQKVECKQVRAVVGPVVRLVENVARSDPSSFETADYLYRLSAGLVDGTEAEPGTKHDPADLAEAIGKSVQHVRNLIRFRRSLPASVLEAWAADHDQRFSFSRLNDLVAMSKGGGDVEAELRRVLGLLSAEDRANLDAAAREDAEVAAAAGEGDEPEAASVQSSKVRRLGRRGAGKLRARLDALGERLADDDRGPLLRDMLRVIEGEAGADVAREHVDRVLAAFGETSDPRAAPAAAR